MTGQLAEVREAVYETFVPAWVTANPSVPIGLDNEKFDKPTATPWARLSVRHKISQQESLGGVGNRRFFRTADIYVQIFGPLDTGTYDCDVLAQSARTILEGIRISGAGDVWITAANVRELGPVDGWCQVLVTAGLNYTEIR